MSLFFSIRLQLVAIVLLLSSMTFSAIANEFISYDHESEVSQLVDDLTPHLVEAHRRLYKTLFNPSGELRDRAKRYQKRRMRKSLRSFAKIIAFQINKITYDPYNKRINLTEDQREALLLAISSSFSVARTQIVNEDSQFEVIFSNEEALRLFAKEYNRAFKKTGAIKMDSSTSASIAAGIIGTGIVFGVVVASGGLAVPALIFGVVTGGIAGVGYHGLAKSTESPLTIPHSTARSFTMDLHEIEEFLEMTQEEQETEESEIQNQL